MRSRGRVARDHMGLDVLPIYRLGLFS